VGGRAVDDCLKVDFSGTLGSLDEMEPWIGLVVGLCGCCCWSDLVVVSRVEGGSEGIWFVALAFGVVAGSFSKGGSGFTSSDDILFLVSIGSMLEY
jgi:drug/metabolite transporter (DMT)-like permease